MRYAVLDSNNVILNIIVWDGVVPYNQEDGLLVSINDDVGIGWRYDGSSFVPPAQAAASIPDFYNTLEANLNSQEFLATKSEFEIKLARELYQIFLNKKPE